MYDEDSDRVLVNIPNEPHGLRVPVRQQSSGRATRLHVMKGPSDLTTSSNRQPCGF
jgi:hypothetical protein